MSKLLTLYGNAMMSIGIWFIKRGQDYAQWYSATDVEQHFAGKE